MTSIHLIWKTLIGQTGLLLCMFIDNPRLILSTGQQHKWDRRCRQWQKEKGSRVKKNEGKTSENHNLTFPLEGLLIMQFSFTYHDSTNIYNHLACHYVVQIPPSVKRCTSERVIFLSLFYLNYWWMNINWQALLHSAGHILITRPVTHII